MADQQSGSAVAQHVRRGIEGFTPRRGVLDTPGLLHRTPIGVDPAGGSRGGHALLDLRAGGCARRVVKSATMRLTLGNPATCFRLPATGFSLTLGRPAACLGLAATGFGFATAIIGT
jgi:hypothetical protein